MMEPSRNLLCDSIHPPGVGRWVPGGNAATLPLAALHYKHAIHYPLKRVWNCRRGARSSPINLICPVHGADQRLGWRSFASLVEWPCKAPCAPSTLFSAGLLSRRRLRPVTDKTTVKTTDETTSHSAMPPKNGGQAAGYSHLTDKTTSHSTKLSAEELLAGHPKDDNQVVGYNPTKDAGQVIGYSHSTRRANYARQVAGYGGASRLREQPPVAPLAPDASQHRAKATSLRFLEIP